MRIPAASLAALLACSAAWAADFKVGDRIHVSGCDEKVLVMKQVTLWAEPGFIAGSDKTLDKNRQVASVSGGVANSQARRCSGDAVVIREVRRVGRGDWARVEAIASSAAGWLDPGSVGKPFDTSTCATTFKGNAAAIAKCKG